MNRWQWIAAAAVAALISGCAYRPPLSQETLDAASAPVYCSEPVECERVWDALQTFVARSSRLHLQTVTKVVIATAGPLNNNPAMAYRITREAAGPGRSEIRVAAACGTSVPALCEMSPILAIAHVKRHALASK